MNGMDSPTVLWLFVFAQFAGIAIAWVARLCEGSAFQSLIQAAFLGVLTLIGLATIAALAVGPGFWLACSATLAFMVLAATCDFRGSRQAATW